MTKFSLALKDCLQVPQFSNDFMFLVGGTTYSTNQTLASIHCRIVRLLINCDPTAQYIEFPHPDPENQFGLFTQFINGTKIQIDETNYDFLTFVANYFQCDQLLSYLSDYLQHIYTLPVVFRRLSKAENPVFCQPEIRYLASNFLIVMEHPELARQFTDLPFFVIDAVLASKAVALNDDIDDKQMMAFISSIIKKRGREFTSLYAHIIFEYLEKDDVQDFVNYISGHREDISGALWFAIAQRLVLPVVPDTR